MDNELKPSEVVKATGISRSYAWEILQGKREPSDSLAILIYRSTGWKARRLRNLDEPEIDQLERLIEKQAAA